MFAHIYAYLRMFFCMVSHICAYFRIFFLCFLDIYRTYFCIFFFFKFGPDQGPKTGQNFRKIFPKHVTYKNDQHDLLIPKIHFLPKSATPPLGGTLFGDLENFWKFLEIVCRNSIFFIFLRNFVLNMVGCPGREGCPGSISMDLVDFAHFQLQLHSRLRAKGMEAKIF